CLDMHNIPLVNLLDDLLSEYNSSLRTLLKLLDTEGNKNSTAEASFARVATSKKIVLLDENLQKLY
ncbi:hypothetical protein GGI02_005279, partial [Coemansia sp. RSA 2322]